MASGASEPARIYWAAGIAISLVVHTSAVAGAALLAGRYAAGAAPTEITFSDAALPTVRPVRAEVEQAAPAEAAAVAVRETLVPSVTPETSAEAAAEPLKPLETEAAPAAEAAQPTESATQAAEAAEPLPAEQPAAAEVQPSVQAETLPEASPEAVQPATPAEAAPASEAETATALASDDTLAAAEGFENLPSSATAPAEPALSGEAVEAIAALEQPDKLGAAETVAPDQRQAESPTAETAPAETVAALSSPTTGTETLQPAAPPVTSATETAPSAPAGRETAQPIAPSTETVTGLEPEALGPVSEQTDTGAGPAVPIEAETAQPIEEPVETALLVPARPNSSLGTEVDKPSDRYRKIVDFIREYGGGDCFIALPAMDLDGDVTFQTFGRDKTREDAFRQALLGIDGLRAEISSGNVADPQCLALSFARSAKRYPGFSLMIDLDEAEMASGAKLSGSVLNAKGRELHLLLVDDEGKVQSIDRFLQAGGGTDRAFSVPLTLTGGKPVVTKQILLAITTDPSLPELAGVDQPADLFFSYLGAAIEANQADVDLAVEGFSVR